MPPLSLRRPLASLRLLFAHKGWLIGFLAGIGGWVLYVAALALAPLSLVQATSAGGNRAPGSARLAGGGRGSGARGAARSGGVGARAGTARGLGCPGAPPTAGALARSRRSVGCGFRRGRGARRRAPRSRPGRRGRARDRGRDVLLGGRRLDQGGGARWHLARLRPGASRLSRPGVRCAPARVPARAGAHHGRPGHLAHECAPDRGRTTLYGEGLGSLPALRLAAFACTVLGATLLARPSTKERGHSRCVARRVEGSTI
jgi:hypothetical protein